MTIDEKKELIENANSLEELEEVRKKIEEPEEEPKEEPKTEEEPKVEPEDIIITPEEERKLVRDAVDESQLIERKGEKQMELRNSKEYIDAFADYIKTGKNEELRALVTTNGYATGNSATVEVPDFVYDVVKTAWERDDLMARVRRLSAQGNMSVQFEAVAGDATVHTEGYGEVEAEQLILGIITLTPKSIKKWVGISDEALDMRGEEFLRYIYDELTYKIAKETAKTLLNKIANLPASLSPNADGVYDKVSANIIKEAPAIGTIAKAISNLNDETRDITVVMNKLTWGAFKEAQYNGNYANDIFEGATVVFNNTLPAYSSANANQVYCIVGDFDTGALANYPNGDDITIKFDDKTEMTSDIVRILGRRFVAVEPVQDKAFCLIGKPASV